MNLNHPLSIRIDVLIAYDQLEAHQYASELCQRVTQRLGSACEMNLTAWNFRLLEIPQLMCTVAQTAARAAMIIIAADGNNALPSGIKTWVGMVVGAKEAAVGLIVAQLHGIRREQKEAAPAYLYLKQMADAAGFDFLAHVVEPIETSTPDWCADIHERTHKRTSVLAGILLRV